MTSTRDLSSRRRSQKKRINIVAFLGLVIISGSVFSILYVLKPQIEQKPVAVDQLQVPVINASIIQAFPSVELSGRVQAEGMITLIAKTQGDVTSPNDQLKPGTFFTNGTILLTIDDKSAKATYSQTLVNLAQSKQALSLETQLATIAKNVWEKEFKDRKISDLAARKLQLQTAQTSVMSASAAVERAEYALDSTKVKAPFNGYIEEVFVENHQYVNAGTRLLQIYPTDYFVVPVPINMAQLQKLQLPIIFNNDFGDINIKLSTDVAGIEQTWPAKIIRSDNKLDPVTRVTTLAVAVTSPLDTTIHHYPLVAGMFVKVNLTSSQALPITAIPKSALQQNNRVFSLNADNQLIIDPVQVIDYETLQPLPEGYVTVEGLSTSKNIINKTLTNIVSGVVLQPKTN